MVSETEGFVSRNFGIRSTAKNALDFDLDGANYGVLGTAWSEDGVFTDLAYGVRGEACGARVNIGVYGSIKPPSAPGCHTYPSQTFYAGYFAGAVVDNGSTINPSDENLKTNIEVMSGARDLVSSIIS